eukprot:2847843-Alexandrium_andersonii.AAC.1
MGAGAGLPEVVCQINATGPAADAAGRSQPLITSGGPPWTSQQACQPADQPATQPVSKGWEFRRVLESCREIRRVAGSSGELQRVPQISGEVPESCTEIRG